MYVYKYIVMFEIRISIQVKIKRCYTKEIKNSNIIFRICQDQESIKA